MGGGGGGGGGALGARVCLYVCVYVFCMPLKLYLASLPIPTTIDSYVYSVCAIRADRRKS